MCWSLEVSLMAGLTSYAIAAYLWLRNIGADRWHALFIFTFSSIQFTDAAIWYYQNKNDLESPVVTVVKYLIPLILAMEPVMALYGAHYMGKNVTESEILIYGLFFILLLWSMTRAVPKSNKDLIVCKSTKGAFHDSEISECSNRRTIQYSDSNTDTDTDRTKQERWGYWIYFAFLMYPFWAYNKVNSFYIVAAIVTAIALVFAQEYSLATGSNWCLYGNAVSVLSLFYPYLL